ncbi:MAG: hypothetical protein FJ128_09970 [Deltaproteobacteria bacterium]|nr:hypothetical protein [Deltaproteobacteria bacterium]
MELFRELLARLGGRFAAELGIEVKLGPEERQKWFLAAILYGARISGKIAARTYQVFASRGITRPDGILAQGWDNLVALLDAGGYVRYDFKTADKLLAVMRGLKEHYGGDLERLAAGCRDYPELESRLRGLAPGLGPVTVNIFLRELRGVWPLAEPPLSPLALLAAAHLRLLDQALSPEAALAALADAWEARPVPGFDLADLEAALVRLGRDYCRKPAGPPCPLGDRCGRVKV